MRRAERLLIPALVVLLAVAVGASTGKLFTDSDAAHYLALAAGRPVAEPFAARQLAPLLVRALTHLGLTLHQGFWLLGIASLAFFVGAVSLLMERAKAPRWIAFAVLGLYFWGLAFSGMVLPDLFYAALLSAFLLLIQSKHYAWASAMLFPLMVARESTILVLLCWLLVAWRTLTWSKRLLSVAATAAGALAVHLLAAGSGGNREGLSPILYLVGKIPWNFAKNVLGLEAWANLNPSCGTPIWHHAFALGPLHDIGYCAIQPQYPIRLIAYALATFGLLPLLLWRVAQAPDPTPYPNLLTRFCLLYGLAAYLMAGLLGYSVQRLYGYGWPAFLVALPALAGAARWRGLRWLLAFLALHFTASWLEWRVDKLPLLAAELALWAAGAWLLHRGFALNRGAP